MRRWAERERELERLASLAEEGRLVVVSGLPGIGKRALLEEHLAREQIQALWSDLASGDVPVAAQCIVVEPPHFEIGGAPRDLHVRIEALLDANPERTVFLLTTDARRYPHAFELRGLSTAIGEGELSPAARLFVEAAPTPIEQGDWPRVELLSRLVDGHPGVLLELAALLRTVRLTDLLERRDRVADLLSVETRRRFDHLLEDLDHDARRVFAAAHAFAGPFLFEDLEAVFEGELGILARAIDALRARGLLARTGPHDAQIVVPSLAARMCGRAESVPVELRERLHERVAIVASAYLNEHVATPPAASAGERRFGVELLETIWREGSADRRSMALLTLAADDFTTMPPHARSYWTRALEEARPGATSLDRRAWLRAALGVAFGHLQDNPSEASRYIEMVSDASQGDEDLHLLASYAEALRRAGEPLEQSRARFRDIERRAVQLENFVVAGLAAVHLSWGHARSKEYDAAIASGARAVSHAERLESAGFLAKVRMSLANAYVFLGHCDEAKRTCLEVVRSAELAHDPPARAYLAVVTGVAHFALQEDTEAISWFREALRAEHDFAGSKRTFGSARASLAILSLRSHAWESAIADARRAIPLFRAIGADRELIATLLTICVAAHRTGRALEVQERVSELRQLVGSRGLILDEPTNLVLRLLSTKPGSISTDPGNTGDEPQAEAKAFVEATLRTKPTPGSFDYEASCLARLVEALLELRSSQQIEIRIHGTGERLEVGPSVIDLQKFPTLRRILWALATSHWQDAAQSVSMEELAASVWTGERISHAAMRNRIHVSLSKLRKLGLTTVFEVSDERVRISGLVRLVRT